MKKRTSKQRLAITVFDVVYEATETIEGDDLIGPDLAYLMGAILKGHGHGCEWPEDRQIVRLLREHFPQDHQVWEHVEIERSDPALN